MPGQQAARQKVPVQHSACRRCQDNLLAAQPEVPRQKAAQQVRCQDSRQPGGRCHCDRYRCPGRRFWRYWLPCRRIWSNWLPSLMCCGNWQDGRRCQDNRQTGQRRCQAECLFIHVGKGATASKKGCKEMEDQTNNQLISCEHHKHQCSLAHRVSGRRIGSPLS